MEANLGRVCVVYMNEFEVPCDVKRTLDASPAGEIPRNPITQWYKFRNNRDVESMERLNYST
eukprot:4462460-Amphidinium_carterae.2